MIKGGPGNLIRWIRALRANVFKIKKRMGEFAPCTTPNRDISLRLIEIDAPILNSKLLGVSWGNSLQLWIVAVTWYGESVYMSCTDKLYNVTLKVTYWSLSGATRDVQKERLVNSLNHITWELRKRPLCTNCAFFLGLLKRMGWLRDKWGILKHFPQRICISKSREK